MRYKTFEFMNQSFKGIDLPVLHTRLSSEREMFWFKEITKTLDAKAKPKKVAEGMTITRSGRRKDNIDQYAFLELMVSENSEWFNFDILYKNFKYRNTDALAAICKIIGWA